MSEKQLPQWQEGMPTEPGFYIGFSMLPERRKEKPDLYGFDGEVFQHWSGLYDHAITHWIPCGLPYEKKP